MYLFHRSNLSFLSQCRLSIWPPLWKLMLSLYIMFWKTVYETLRQYIHSRLCNVERIDFLYSSRIQSIIFSTRSSVGLMEPFGLYWCAWDNWISNLIFRIIFVVLFYFITYFCIMSKCALNYDLFCCVSLSHKVLIYILLNQSLLFIIDYLCLITI